MSVDRHSVVPEDSRAKPVVAGAWPGRARRPVVFRSAGVSILRRVGRGLLDWFPLFVALFVYDEINNRLGPLLPPAHVHSLIQFDRTLFGGRVATIELQRIFYTFGHPRAWDWVALVIYSSHFFMTLLCALVLWVRSRPRFLSYRTLVLVLTTLGFATYVTFPAVPPWLASQLGQLGPTHRVVRELWEQLGLRSLAGLFSGSSVYANDVAAVPSLHAAYPLLIAVFFWRSSRSWLRVALAAYALAMPLVLIYFAEHYALDIVLGWLYVGAALALARSLGRRLEPRRSANGLEPASPRMAR
jgi:hypothetical protein